MLPTFRRADRLRATLHGLARQRGVRTWEVIVVDNDPAGSARPALEGVTAPVRYVVEPHPGASHARNRGTAEAQGDVVAMLDDDVVPEPDWLRELTAPIDDDRADLTGGPVRLEPQVDRPRWFDEDVVGRYLTHHDLGGTPRELAVEEFVVTANAAFRSSLLVRVGGFRPELGPRPGRHLVGDDVDLHRRCVALGARAWWVPTAHVVHELPADRLRPSWILGRAWLQGRSDWLVERSELEQRRWNGARVAGGWLGSELRRRMREGPTRPEVAFHLACDVARTAGRLWEAATWSRDTGEGGADGS